ncbi:MAG TPA: ABC transporter ATP-binding protein [Pseudonocardiaceae bacterium]
MTAAIRTERLTKRYGRHPALTDVTVTVPTGRVVGLVGPNGAGKSTLLGIAAGLITPTSGEIEVLGGRPGQDTAQLARVGFVAQDTPVYGGLTVAEHLRLGAGLNPGWDAELARQRIARLGLDPARRAAKLSGGQRAQLALTLAAAKRPELLLLDEPVAALDPLARRDFLRGLMEFVAELGVGVVLSSHVLADLERVCDHLVLLAESRVLLAGDTEELLATHYRVVGPRGCADALPAGVDVVQAEHTARQSTLVVHDPGGALLRSPCDAEPVGLEDMVLAHLTRAAGAAPAPTTEEPLEARR